MKNILALGLMVILVTSIILLSGYTQVQKTSVDTSICDKLSILEHVERLECYTNLAISHRNLTVCNKLSGWYGLLGNKCYSLFAAEMKDISICERMGELCMSIVEKNKEDEATDRMDCLNSIPRIKQPCYRYVAVALKDNEICDKITDYFEKNACYSDVAKAMGLIS